MLRIFPVSVVAFLVIFSGVEGLIISEIHPNPDDSCRDCSEWIEIFNDNKTNFTINVSIELC